MDWKYKYSVWSLSKLPDLKQYEKLHSTVFFSFDKKKSSCEIELWNWATQNEVILRDNNKILIEIVLSSY